MSTPVRFHAKMEDGSVKPWCNVGTMGWYSPIKKIKVWNNWVENTFLDTYVNVLQDGDKYKDKYNWVEDIEWITPCNHFMQCDLHFKIIIDDFDGCESHAESLTMDEIEYLDELESNYVEEHFEDDN